jgi:hypothetical protein
MLQSDLLRTYPESSRLVLNRVDLNEISNRTGDETEQREVSAILLHCLRANNLLHLNHIVWGEITAAGIDF